MYIALFVAVLIVAVMFHEFGHFATAKACGMKCEKFFFGFGPTLWSTQRGETEYGVKLFPAGGFVKIIGMSAWEDTDPADAGRRFFEQPAWQRFIVLVSGSATHVITAAVLLFVGLTVSGIPGVSNQVESVVEDSPAQEAGLSSDDRVVAVDGEETENFAEVSDLVVERGGETVPITVERDGTERTLEVTLAERTSEEGEERGFLGIAPQPEKFSAGEAARSLVVGEWSLPRQAYLTVYGLGQAFSPDNLMAWVGSAEEGEERPQESLVSPVGIGQLVSSLGQGGDLFFVLLLLAHLNVVLGLVNLAPLPPLDGGHVAVLVVEESVNGARRLLGHAADWRLNPAVLTPIALMVILVLVTLMVTAVYIDIVSPASELLRQ